jgi:selT/selW/selH-like putative selenoprotein
VVGEILQAMKNDVERAVLVPSGGGVFAIRVDGKTVFSKAERGRFPEPGEAASVVGA